MITITIRCHDHYVTATKGLHIFNVQWHEGKGNEAERGYILKKLCFKASVEMFSKFKNHEFLKIENELTSDDLNSDELNSDVQL